ncbi:MAG: 4-hydroxy-tetrahydrodipicolinate synthase [Cyanobacteria bacterium QS_4_48_99]|nr:MAG: 4-hydroxy-tetrahydrodipicolinate synthase [Cyanobacteria bacterium QS_4_48_99]
MSHDQFGRVITAMVTPLAEDGSVDYGVAEQLVDHLVSQETDGIVVCGTTGESPSLSWEEEYELFQVVQKAVTPGVKVIAGTGSNSTTEAIAATQKAAKLGLDGTLQVVPYYNKPPQEGLYQHFRVIAQACPDQPMMLYNIPGRTGRSLSLETITSLAEIDNIVAIKEASGDFDQICQLRRQSSLAIYSGDDYLTLPLVAVGGTGVVSVASHLVGSQLQKMIRDFEAGKTAAARETHLKLYPLFKALFASTNPIPIKAALKLQGWKVGSPRLPLCELSPDLQKNLEIVLKDLYLI